MADATGYFVDWAGQARNVATPGGGYHCDVDMSARYVAVRSKQGALIHEATYYKTLDDIAKAGIKAELVDESVPW